MKKISLLADLLTGAAAGATAAVPMSWSMELMHRLLPHHESYPLPPRQITEETMQQLGLRKYVSKEAELWISIAAHLAYGAGAGALFAAIERKAEIKPLAAGAGFGVILWFASYMGLMPAMGILKPATKHPLRRSALMIVAHIVWGTATAIFTDLAETEENREHLNFLGAGDNRNGSEKTDA